MPALRNRNLIALALLVALLGASYTSPGLQLAPSVVHPTVAVQVFSVPWLFLTSFSISYVKIGDLATFDVLNPNSVVELILNSYIRVNSFALGSAGAIFELRVDDTASSYGPARTRTYEAAKDIPASIDGIFSNLSVGSHVASVWVRGWNAGGSDASVNPYTWDSDHLVVKEYTPFGFTYLPVIKQP